MLFVLSSMNYPDSSHNYGDCFLFIDGNQAIVYDCGSLEHARRVIEILDRYCIKKAAAILSHNDSDHFDGIPYLIEQGYVDTLFTILLLKYKDALLDKIDDGRRNRESIGKAIKETYDNIASLSGKVKLKDVYESAEELPKQLTFIGPTLEYMIEAAAKGLDGRQGDIIDRETIVNATSVQIQFDMSGKKVLLTGDCTPAAIPDEIDLSEYQYIQLPHHGKFIHAQIIFDRVGIHYHNTFLVCDNTGNTNGGSDELMKNRKGHNIQNTKIDGELKINPFGSSTNNHGCIPTLFTGRTLGI